MVARNGKVNVCAIARRLHGRHWNEKLARQLVGLSLSRKNNEERCVKSRQVPGLAVVAGLCRLDQSWPTVETCLSLKVVSAARRPPAAGLSRITALVRRLRPTLNENE